MVDVSTQREPCSGLDGAFVENVVAALVNALARPLTSEIEWMWGRGSRALERRVSPDATKSESGNGALN